MFLVKNAVIVGLYLVILFALGAASTASAQLDSASRSVSPSQLGQLVDIGGWRLHLYGQGVNHPGPTVILEAGAGGFSFDWSLIQPGVASFARVYAYDRAGSAWSQLGPRPHTMHQTVYELHALLTQARIPGPYILVGASYGGILMRLFAQLYPADVAGMVLVDSGLENSVKYVNGKPVRAAEVAAQAIPAIKKIATLEDTQLAQTPEARKFLDDVLAKSNIRLTDPKLNPAYLKLPEFAQKLRLWASSRYEYYTANDNRFEIDELAGLIQYQKAHPQYLGSTPLIVLTKGQGNASDLDPAEQERKHGQAALQDLSSNSKQIIAHQSGHHIEVDDPARVIEAIREVVEAARQQRAIK